MFFLFNFSLIYIYFHSMLLRENMRNQRLEDKDLNPLNLIREVVISSTLKINRSKYI